MGFYNRDR